MKSVFISMLVLLTLVSCDSSSKKEERSEDCSINGQKVDCSAFKEGGAGETLSSLSVSVTGKYEIRDGAFRVLTEMNKQETKAVGGNTYTCSVSFPTDLVLDIMANERELIFSKDGQSEIYERSRGSLIDRSHYEFGLFENMDNEAKIKMTMKLDSNGHITLGATCYYNK